MPQSPMPTRVSTSGNTDASASTGSGSGNAATAGASNDDTAGTAEVGCVEADASNGGTSSAGRHRPLRRAAHPQAERPPRMQAAVDPAATGRSGASRVVERAAKPRAVWSSARARRAGARRQQGPRTATRPVERPSVASSRTPAVRGARERPARVFAARRPRLPVREAVHCPAVETAEAEEPASPRTAAVPRAEFSPPRAGTSPSPVYRSGRSH